MAVPLGTTNDDNYLGRMFTIRHTGPEGNTGGTDKQEARALAIGVQEKIAQSISISRPIWRQGGMCLMEEQPMGSH